MRQTLGKKEQHLTAQADVCTGEFEHVVAVELERAGGRRLEQIDRGIVDVEVNGEIGVELYATVRKLEYRAGTVVVQLHIVKLYLTVPDRDRRGGILDGPRLPDHN